VGGALAISKRLVGGDPEQLDPASHGRYRASNFRGINGMVARLETVPNLARAWGHHLATFAIGAAGDLAAQRSPSRRSTILAVGRKR